MYKEVTKLYNGFTSVRSYEVERCLSNREDLVITYKDQVMTIANDKILTSYVQLNTKPVKSKYVGFYYLYDFKFIPDKVYDNSLFD